MAGRGRGRDVKKVEQAAAASASRAIASTGGDGNGGNDGGELNRAGEKGASWVGVDRGDGANVGRGKTRVERKGPPLIDGKLITFKPNRISAKQGAGGNEVGIVTNYFRMNVPKNWTLYKHHVDFNPPLELTRMKKALLHGAAKEEITSPIIFDGSSLYCAKNLGTLNWTVASKDGTQYAIAIKYTNNLETGDYGYIQFFNVILRNLVNEDLKLKLYGRNYFDTSVPIPVQNANLTLFPGYRMTIRQKENDILFNIDNKFKVIRTSTVAHEYNEAERNGTGDWLQKFKNDILNQVVMTRYNNKTYRVDGLDMEKNINYVFQDKKGENVSLKTYFKKYGEELVNDKLPLLISVSKEKDRRAGKEDYVLLPMEACVMTGLTDSMRSKNGLMKSLAVHTRINPDVRVKKLMDFRKRVFDSGAENKFKTWEMVMDRNLVELKGRQLAPELIVMSNTGNGNTGGYKADWNFMLKSKMYRSEKLLKWLVILPKRFESDARRFVTMIQQSGNSAGFQIAPPILEVLSDERTNSYLTAIDRHTRSEQLQMVLCVIDGKSSLDKYNAIKTKLTLDLGIASQVVLTKNLNAIGDESKTRSIALKVAVQLNCKLGGAPWAVSIPLNTAMIVGFDVCHDSQQKAKCFGAMVSTLNPPNPTRYHSIINHHTDGTELSQFMSANIIEAAMEFKTCTGNLPSTIIFYRDGIGEGDLLTAKEQEAEVMINVLKPFYKKDQREEVKFLYIVVTKSINTRLFMKSRQGLQNPMPGTIVDSVITDPLHYDFFLVSQYVKHGTVMPVHYNVLVDTTTLPPDRLHLLTYKLCHCYYNWPGTIRVPAPVMYAHKLAFQTAQNLHRAPNNSLKNTLYYL